MSKGSEKRARRSRLSRLLGQLNLSRRHAREESRGKRVDRLKLENLERRQLLAGDVGLDTAELIGPVDTGVPAFAASANGGGLTTVTTAEGEPAPDLVQFAKDLASAGAIFYGAHWCPACTQQKQLFDDGANDLPFIEVTNPDRSAGQLVTDNNITAYPTWIFPDQTRATGVLTLQELSSRANVAIPQSETPVFEDIGDQTALIGSPIHIPVDAYDPNGGPLTVTVSVSDPSLLEASVIDGNRSIRVDMEGYGDMVFELFEQRAPTASGRVIQLAQDDFYDDIIFHRVIDDFVIQGGDPTGTGTSGSTLGNFDDDFHPDLQHNRSGILSFAKSSDDTNNSQFFVTEVPTRFLDYNHSVFGQLIEGDDVRDAISEHAVNNSDRPTTDIVINTIEVFADNENSLIMLKPTGSGVGSTNVTVTVTDGDGNTYDETFQVDVNNDTQNSQPYLNAVTVPDRYDPGTPATLQLSATDIEGDAVTYSAVMVSGGSNASASIDQNGLLTVTPANGFTGTVDVRATVRPGPGVTGNSSSDSDNQVFTFNFESSETATAPTAIDLLASSDTGASDSDNITNAGSLSFLVQGVVSGATVQLINQQTSAVLGQAVASGTTVTITTNNIASLGDGTYNVTARQVLNTQVSPQSSPVEVTFDTQSPASVVASANTTGNVSRLYQTDLINDEEGSIEYELTQSPSGATIDSGSGLIQWTPGASDEGTNLFTVRMTDLAGNQRTEDFSVDVAAAPLAEVRLVLKDTSGNEISSVNVGDDFVLEIIGVDARGGFDRDGVFAIYTDILFDSSVVQVKSGSTIEHVGIFTLSPKGSISTGLIDEVGGAATQTVATNEDESLIARVEMTAVASGSVNIRSESADEATSEVLLYGVDNEIEAEAVFYGSANLNVGIDFTLVDDTVSVAEDSGATVIDVLDNDVAGSGTNLSVVTVTQPATGGTVTVNSGVVSFVPDQDFTGTTEFTYRAGDGSGAQDTATVTVTVTPVNDPPTGTDDTFDVIEGTNNNRLEVLANDSIDPDTGETLSVTTVDSNTAGATVSVSTDGQAVLYTPASGFTGTDTFTYTVSDGTATDTVTVTVTVTSSDAPPTAVDDSFTVNEDTAEASFDILQNDTRDVDNQTFVIDSVGTPSDGGSVRISSDGLTFFYEPADDFNGTETVTYTIRDSGGGVATGQITFTVTAINDAPPVLNDTIQVSRGTNGIVVLNLDDLPDNVDGAGETLNLSLSTAQQTTSAGGSASISGSSIFYVPPSDTFTGTDTLTYSVTDGSGTNSTGTLTLEVVDLTERNITVRFSGGQGLAVASSIRLVGTDALGNSVDEFASANGTNLLFSNVLPGEYVVEIPAMPFYTGGDQPQQFSVSAAASDGDVSIDAAIGRIKPEYLSIQDWFGSAPKQSALVAVVPGASALITDPTPDSNESISNPAVSLNDAGTELSISGENDEDPTDSEGPDNVAASVLTTQGALVSPRGQVGDIRLYRLNLNAAEVSYTRTPASQLAAAGTGESEQVQVNPVVESVSNEIVPAGAQQGGLAAAGSGEGESIGQATTMNDVAAPLLTNLNLDSDSEDSESVIPNDVVLEEGASAALGQDTPAGTTNAADQGGAGQAHSDLESVADAVAESVESESLTASRIDRFFRRGR